MRNPIIAGNWKMHKSHQDGNELTQNILSKTNNINSVEIILCPPFTSLSSVASLTKKSTVQCGAQTMSELDEGAFTGDISAQMIQSCGCSHVILGHSERRQYHNEQNKDIQKKIKQAHKYNLIPILCVGETLDQREQGQTLLVIETQLRECLTNIKLNPYNCIIAYEPVWAIGTGKSASPQQAQDVHHFIRSQCQLLFTDEIAKNIRILYGGSVKPDNIETLISQKDIDGALVGGACLKAESFCEIIKKTELIKV